MFSIALCCRIGRIFGVLSVNMPLYFSVPNDPFRKTIGIPPDFRWRDSYLDGQPAVRLGIAFSYFGKIRIYRERIEVFTR